MSGESSAAGAGPARRLVGADGIGSADAADDADATGLEAAEAPGNAAAGIEQAAGTMAAAAAPAAWFGKIPAVGDFVGRRLPRAFRARWDEWLQASLVVGADTFGARWAELYLTFPVWRFLAPPGVVGSEAWTGLLLPSVDRVGRRYPLTLALPVPAITRAGGLAAIERRLSRLGDLVDPVLDGAGIQSLEQMLHEIATAEAQAEAQGAMPAASEEDTRNHGTEATPETAGQTALEVAPDVVASDVASERPPKGTSEVSPDAALSSFSDLTDQLLMAALGQRLLWWQAPAPDGRIATRLLPLEPASFLTLVVDA